MNLGYLFTDNSWGQFDALPLPLQAIEIHYMKKQCQLYLERYQKNCGLLGAPKQKHSEETIISIIDEIEKIRAAHEIQGKGSKMSLTAAYVTLVEKILSNSETEKVFIENKWISSYKLKRKEEIRKLAKQFQQAAYRYRKKLSGT